METPSNPNRKLVLDSGALIGYFQYENFFEWELLTVEGVVAEIRDPASREKMSQLPIKIRIPSDEARKAGPSIMAILLSLRCPQWLRFPSRRAISRRYHRWIFKCLHWHGW